jgi:Icc protein
MKKIAFVSDIHLDEGFPLQNNVDPKKNWSFILNDIRSKGIDEIIFGGDIGETDSYGWFFESLRDFKTKMILGNHDSFNMVIKHLAIEGLCNFSELYYSEEDSFFKYIFLDSSSGRISGVQLKWLDRELTTSKKIIIFIHHPILAIDTPVDKQYPLLNRVQILHLLESIKGEVIVFCGHYHMADNRNYKNITQYATPAASFQIIKEATAIAIDIKEIGYRVLLFDNESIHSEIIMHQYS